MRFNAIDTQLTRQLTSTNPNMLDITKILNLVEETAEADHSFEKLDSMREGKSRMVECDHINEKLSLIHELDDWDFTEH